MVKLNIDGKIVAFDDAFIQSLMINALPDFLDGTRAPQGNEHIVKSALKGILPMLLGMIHKSIAASTSLLPPDLRSKEAKENVIVYAVKYLAATLESSSDGMVIETVGCETNGEYVVTGFNTAPTTLALSTVSK